MPADLTVRLAVASDKAAISNIAEGVGLFPAHLLDEMIADFLSGASVHVWLAAENSGRTIGFAFCEPEALTNGTWNLRAIGVEPSHQGTGVGKALLDRLELSLRDSGGRLLIVETSSEEAQMPACAFYRSAGYTEAARVPEFWDVDVAKIVFWKRL